MHPFSICLKEQRQSILFSGLFITPFCSVLCRGDGGLLWTRPLVMLSPFLTGAFCPAVLAYFIAAISPTLEIANTLLPLYVVTLLFFAGCVMRWVDIPTYWKWCASSVLTATD